MSRSADDKRRLVGLKRAAVKYFTESNWYDVGTLTDLTNAIENHQRLFRSLTFGDPDYAGCAAEVIGWAADQDENNISLLESYIVSEFPEAVAQIEAPDIRRMLSNLVD